MLLITLWYYEHEKSKLGTANSATWASQTRASLIHHVQLP